MPQKTPPKCIQCENRYSPMWRNTENGQICQTCYEFNRNKSSKDSEQTDTNENSNNGNGSGNGEEKKLRKSTRSTRYKSKAATVTSAANKNQSKGRNRRNMFKKNPQKTPVVTATTTYVESLFYNGSYVQIGDIVALVDHDDNTFYAQIRGLLVDTYCEKSAFLTWLIPTKSSPSPNERFDPSTYLIGPDEDFPRKLSCMEFVMHAPSNYYYNKNMPFPLPDGENDMTPNSGFIWTNINNCIR